MSKQEISKSAPANKLASKPSGLKAVEGEGGPSNNTPAEKPKKERKPREPRTIDSDLSAIHARYSKTVSDLREAEQKLLGRLTEVRGELVKAEGPLRKIEEVIAANPTLPGLGVQGTDEHGNGVAAYDPTQYVPPTHSSGPESIPGNLDATAPVPADLNQ